ncbi:MAG TPA: sigma-54-dependent Fis family transcriptional regulator [Thiotrichaceae bacterium]|jgi:two-component system response regulator PilR (NtrC family)|nr:sigma-54-dependent Fis family transcriptional regulator [Thiotrichaceae bacterium]
MSKLALIIDDEPDILELLQITLQRMKVDSHCAENLSTARSLLKEYKFDLCLTDMKLPDGDGVEFVNELQINHPQIPIAVITAHGSMDSAIQALKYGAFDFLIKPVDLNSLRSVVQSALSIKPKQASTKPSIIGNSQIIQDLRETIGKVARSQAPIYISGESGTGKELAAHMIHDYGPRSDKPFIAINCGAIPNDLMESEFFGHIKGSFTGAVSDKKGLFQAADGGTLFLDEVAELPQHMQVKLLRAIQEKVVRPIGAQEEIHVDVRILSATNCDLSEQVNQGLFRQDLLYRINVIELKIPPLRSRVEDIPDLIEHILKKIVLDSGNKKLELSKEAGQLLESYNFPGNIRELENILERAATLCSDNLIDKADIQLTESPHTVDEKHTALDSMLGDIEKQKIMEALEKTRWNKTAAAKLLGISFRALRYRLEKLGMD